MLSKQRFSKEETNYIRRGLLMEVLLLGILFMVYNLHPLFRNDQILYIMIMIVGSVFLFYYSKRKFGYKRGAFIAVLNFLAIFVLTIILPFFMVILIHLIWGLLAIYS